MPLPDPLVKSFEEAFFRVLFTPDWADIYYLSALDADDRLAAMPAAELRRLGLSITRDAPCLVAGYTRFHRLAMCVADHLEAHGVAVI